MAFREGFEPPTDALEVHLAINKPPINGGFLNTKRSNKMTTIDANDLIEKLKNKRQEYLSAVAIIEDCNEPHVKQEAIRIIETSIVHENIALDEIQN